MVHPQREEPSYAKG